MQENSLNRLKELIKSHLQGCDTTLYPTLCQFKSTAEGKAHVEKDILERCAGRGLSVGQAMLEMEKEYNSNMNLD